MSAHAAAHQVNPHPHPGQGFASEALGRQLLRPFAELKRGPQTYRLGCGRPPCHACLRGGAVAMVAGMANPYGPMAGMR
jgi:hypothetical protein